MLLKLYTYITTGFLKREDNEEALKTYLIYSFSFFGFIFLFGFGLNDVFYDTNKALAGLLLGGSILLLFNIIYLRSTQNHTISGAIVLYITFILMFYLVYSGGIDNTGPLWIFCLPAIVILIHGLKRGAIELLIFLSLIFVILYAPDNIFLTTEYSDSMKIRIVLSFLVMIILSSVYGYFREQSLTKMKNLQKELEFYLRRDELTGLYNRRGYQAKTTLSSQLFTSVLMCDIDYFKNINDSYGHDVGDFTIKEISNCISNALRSEDIAVRWGGEEFLILLSDTVVEDAYLVSEKLRKSVESLTLKYNNEIKFQVTLSIGIKALDKNMTLEEAIKEADIAMYHSKKAGRNKTTIA